MDFVNYIILFFIPVTAIIQLDFALSTPRDTQTQAENNTGNRLSETVLAEIIQILVLSLFAMIVMTRSGIIFEWFTFATRILIWFVVGFFIVSAFVFISSPKPKEKWILGPLNILMLAFSILTALS